jgi:hypothetical protein
VERVSAGDRRAISGPRRRLLRFALVALTGLLLLAAVWEAWLVLPPALSGHAVGIDFNLYMERARAWLAGDGFYPTHQLTGSPYEIAAGDALYPPSILYLLIPATVLPGFLWWLIPASIVAFALRRHRPRLWGWTYIALAFCWPRTWQAIIFGNPVIWVVAAVAAGTVWGWPYVGAFLKPTFGIFGLIGVRRRAWWVALGVAIILALPLLTMWPDYFVALVNARVGGSMAPDYLWGELPLVALPVVAWLASASAPSRACPPAAAESGFEPPAYAG